ncbi:MAG: YceI family protein [Pseudomonadales bacterium]
MYRAMCLLLIGLFTPVAYGDWQLDADASSLSFTSVKNGSVIEAHRFRTLSGSVSVDGKAQFNVSLDSIDTLIPVRDERMQTMLFEIEQYPDATFSAEVPITAVTQLEVGDAMEYLLKGTLSIRRARLEVSVPVSILRAGEGAFHVVSIKPLLVEAGNFGLLKGIEALREIAGLDAITPVVPVSFSLVYREQP